MDDVDDDNDDEIRYERQIRWVIRYDDDDDDDDDRWGRGKSAKIEREDAHGWLTITILTASDINYIIITITIHHQSLLPLQQRC